MKSFKLVVAGLFVMWIAVVGGQTVQAQGSIATQACSGYFAPGTNIVTCQYSYPATNELWSLLWRPTLPNTNWTLGNVSGDGSPSNIENEIVFLDFDFTNNPLVFTYEVIVPASEAGVANVGGTVEYWLDNMVNPETNLQANVLALGQLHHLAVTTPYGSANPSAGLHTYSDGAMLTNTVSTPVATKPSKGKKAGKQ